MPRLPLALFLAAGLAFSASAGAESPTLETCARAYGTCVDTCTERHDSESAQAGCTTRCAASRAKCEAEAGYEQAKPWLRDQIDKLEDFLRGFRDDPEATAPAERESRYKDL
ncbi:MAG: hypothetical protein VR70_09255 [Rhodospirillaceae bacterium BRH_c57]|nr:MAG: hypothetical protein VR70_09255 [Rhodospirillaceae bacterium BRH_c57]